MEDNSAEEQVKEARGFFGGLAESLRSHFDERLRSPFAGAFLLAWLAVNWRAILLLFLSSKPVEERIELVSSYLNTYSLVFHPLWLAAVLTCGFYVASLVFLALLELYGAGRRKVEQMFDHVRWISPVAYITLKTKFRERNKELMDLASDNLELVESEKKKVADLSANKLALQAELAERTTELQTRTIDSTNTATRLRSAEFSTQQLTTENSQLKARLEMLGRLAADLQAKVTGAEHRRGSLGQVELTRPMSKEDVHGTFLRLQKQLATKERVSELLMERLTSTSLEKYTHARYPVLPFDKQLGAKLLADISAAGLESSIPSIKELNDAISAAEPAVDVYSLDRPDLFKSGTDFVTKSLGFIFPKFRAIHGFGPDSMAAFSKYEQLLEMKHLQPGS